MTSTQSSQSSNLIIYVGVFRDKKMVMSDFSTAQGNHIQFVLTVITKVQGNHAKKSFKYDKYGFHVLNEDQFTFVVMADQEFKLRVAFACLDDIKNAFFEQYSQNQRENAVAYAFQIDFSKVLRMRVEKYNAPDSDKLTQVRANMDNTKNIMMENLDKLLERGEKLDILVQKTEHMVTVSTDMKKHATYIRRNMWWRNKKIMLLLILITIILIYGILVVSCGGFALKTCT